MEYDCREGSRDMPEWLLLEILLRLPVKSIFRFKTISKHWYSLITDPSFARSYSNFEINKNGHSYQWTLLFCYMNTCFGKIPPKYTGLHAAFELCHPHELLRSPRGVNSFLSELIYQSPQPDYIKLLACDNGLLLCCATQQWQELYFVCNPLTLHWVAIPRRSQLHKWVSIGFMVEPEDGSFMVVRIAEFSGSSTILDLETFSSREGKWIEKKLVCDSPVCLFIAHRQAVPFRGIFHWREYSNRIISYNPMVETKQCRLIDMPRDRDRDGQGVLRVSHCRLRHFEICTRYSGCGFYVWVLENYDLGEWCLQFKVPFDEIWSTNRLLCRSVQCHRSPLHPLTFHPLNSEVVYLMCGDRLASCDLKEKRLEIEREDRFSLSSLNSWTVFPFVLPPWPTLVPKPSW